MLRRTLYVLFAVTLFAFCAADVAHAQDAGDRETITKSGTSAAPFLKLGVGARPIAMGGTFVAEASDLSALYWNAAGLAHLRGSSVQLAYTDYLQDVQYSYAAFGTRLGNMGSLALSLIYLDSGDMAVRTVTEPEGTGEQFNVQNISLQVTYARALTDRFAIGGAAKFVQERIWHSTASSVAFDIGTLFTTPYERLRLGASFSNFGPKMQMGGRDIVVGDDPFPDDEGTVNIVNRQEQTGRFSLPLLFRVGIAWDAVATADHRIVLSTDAAHPNDNSEYVNLGGEYVFRDLIALRGGYRHLFEEDGIMQYTFGGGLNLRMDRTMRARIDYAYAAFNRLGNTHWFTLDLSF